MEERSSFCGGEVVVEVEVLCIGLLIGATEVEGVGGGSHFVEKISAVS
jgi:hypothetical protein